MKGNLKHYLTIFSAAILLTGCASFRNNEVANVESLPDVSQYQNKPSVFVEVAFFRGKPGDVVSEVPVVRQHAQEIVGKVLSDSSLFSKYSFDSTDKQAVDYTLHIDIYNYNNAALASVSGFISGFTFGIIPGGATDHYVLETKLTDKTGELVNEAANEDSFTMWLGLWFIPAMSNTPDKAFTQTLENQLKAILKELVESGKLKYSQMLPHMASHRFTLARR
jgi:hypothetical protein